MYGKIILAREVLLAAVCVIQRRPRSRSFQPARVLLELFPRQARCQSRLEDVLAVHLLQRHVLPVSRVRRVILKTLEINKIIVPLVHNLASGERKP